MSPKLTPAESAGANETTRQRQLAEAIKFVAKGPLGPLVPRAGEAVGISVPAACQPRVLSKRSPRPAPSESGGRAAVPGRRWWSAESGLASGVQILGSAYLFHAPRWQPRYRRQRTSGGSHEDRYALIETYSHQIVKVYRSRQLAIGDAEFLNQRALPWTAEPSSR